MSTYKTPANKRCSKCGSLDPFFRYQVPLNPNVDEDWYTCDNDIFHDTPTDQDEAECVDGNSEVDYLREALRKRIEWDKEKLEQLTKKIKRQEAKLQEMGDN